MPIKKDRLFLNIAYAVAALFYLWIAFCVPYTHDDWDWGLSNGVSQLLTASINSRYAGNFFVVVMTRSRILKTLIMAFTSFLIPVGMARLVTRDLKEDREKHQLFYYLLSNLLILLIGSENWRQTYGWVSGFANYVISVLFLLLHLYELLRVFDPDPFAGKDTYKKGIFLGCTSMIGQLFLENLTIYFVALVLFICVVYRRKFHKIPKSVLFMAIGSVLGLLVMFSSSIYSSLWNTGKAVDGVRSLSILTGAGLGNNLKNLVIQIAGMVRRGGEKQLVINCVLLCLLAYALMCSKNIKAVWRFVLVAVNVGIAVYFSLVEILNISYTAAITLTSLLGLAINCLFFIVVTIEVFIVFWDNKQQMYKAGVLWISVVAYLAPLVITTLHAPRLYYICNVFTILVICLLIQHIGFGINKEKGKLLRNLVLVGTVALLLYYVNIYNAINSCNQQRLEVIEQSVAEGCKEIELPKYPYENYLHHPNPSNEKRVDYYRQFYNIPQDTQIIFK